MIRYLPDQHHGPIIAKPYLPCHSFRLRRSKLDYQQAKVNPFSCARRFSLQESDHDRQLQGLHTGDMAVISQCFAAEDRLCASQVAVYIMAPGKRVAIT
jgi:hypothetical protein